MKKAVNVKVFENAEKANRIPDEMLKLAIGGERRWPFALDVNPPWSGKKNPPAEGRRGPFSLAFMLPMGRRPRPLGWKWGDDWSDGSYFE